MEKRVPAPESSKLKNSMFTITGRLVPVELTCIDTANNRQNVQGKWSEKVGRKGEQNRWAEKVVRRGS